MCNHTQIVKMLHMPIHASGLAILVAASQVRIFASEYGEDYGPVYVQ